MAVKSFVYRPVAVYKATTINYDGTKSTSAFSYSWNCDTVKDGVSVPRYREAIASMTSATSAYSVKGKDVEWSNVTFSATTEHPSSKRVIVYLHEGYGLNNRPIHSALPLEGSVKGAAVAKFFSKLADAISRFKGLVFAGELRESLDTIGNNLTRLMKLLSGLWGLLRGTRKQLRRALRKAKSRSRRRNLIAAAEKRASSWYLEFTFGVQPLIEDIESLYGAFCKERAEVERIHARWTEKGETRSFSTAAFCSSRILMDRTDTNRTVVRSTCTGAIKHVIPERPNSLEGTAEALGITIQQVIPSIWELTPFSFLVDYFVNIGDLLNTAVYGNTSLYYSCQSTLLKSEVEVWCSNARKAPDTYLTYKTTDINASSVRISLPNWHFRREPLSPLNAAINFHIPYNGKQWVNMVALFVQWAHKFRDSSD